jgi:hypothetical protein
MSELRGKELYVAAINQIIAKPETWDQSEWHCGTTHCVGGHCQIMGGRPESIKSVCKDCQDLLGLDYDAVSWMTSANRTFVELYEFAKTFPEIPNYSRLPSEFEPIG